MKKKLLFILLLLLPFLEVDAASVTVCKTSGYHNDLKGSEGCSSSISAITNNDSYVYEIQDVTFTKDKVTVSGFALLRDIDNESNKYWLIAESETGETFVSSVVNGTGGAGTGLSSLDYSTSEKASDGTMLCKASDNVSSGTYNYLLNTHYVYRVQNKKRDDVFNSDGDLLSNREWIGCLSKSMTDDRETYSNLEFNLEMSLNQIKEYFTKDTDIALKLLMQNSTNSNYYLTDIYTYRGDIHLNGDANTVIKNATSTDIVGQKVRMMAEDAYIRNDNNKVMKYNNGTNNQDPLQGKFYVSTSSSDSGTNYIVVDVKNSYKPRLYGLKVSTTTNQYASGTPIFKSTTSSNYIKGYAYSIWIRINGRTTFQLVEGKPEIECNPDICIGSNCVLNSEPEGDVCKPEYTLTSILDDDGGSASINTCTTAMKTGAVSKGKVEEEIFHYKISGGKIVIPEEIVDDVKIKGTTYKLCGSSSTRIGSDVYVPIRFRRKINYSVNYKFDINGFGGDDSLGFYDEMIVNRRRGFPFNFDYGVGYSANLARGSISPTRNNSYTSDVYTYEDAVDIHYYDSSGSCVPATATIRLTNNDYLYKINVNRVERVYTYGNLVNSLDLFVSSLSINAPSGVKLKFPDYSREITETFSCELDSSLGLGDGYKCEYNLPEAYWNKKTNVYPEIQYGSDYSGNPDYEKIDIDGVNKHYIPYNYPYNSLFSFDIDASNLSIVEGLDIILDMTCSVKTPDDEDDDPLATINYRPIDVSNPFPNGEGTMKQNWKEYNDAYGLARVNKTFDLCTGGLGVCVSYQTNVFKNSDKNAISSVASSLGNYSSIEETISDDGNSKIISELTVGGTKLFSSADGYHNTFGIFDPSIDKAQWE